MRKSRKAFYRGGGGNVIVKKGVQWDVCSHS